ncbi:MAG: hypothetical protein ABW032_09545 [Burkholderiaceae bacterium]
MSDLLFRTGHGLEPQRFPPENQVNSLSDYFDLFVEAGFPAHLVAVERTTDLQLVPFMAHMARQAGVFREEPCAGAGPESWRTSLIIKSLLNVADSVIVVARKGGVGEA